MMGGSPRTLLRLPKSEEGRSPQSLAPPRLPTRSRVGDQTEASESGQKRLIVDDEPLFRLGAAAALADDERLEFMISEAGDGEAGLARVAAEEPAVVLVDLHMPRLDGDAVLREAKERWTQIPWRATSSEPPTPGERSPAQPRLGASR
jgi:CheY-like chemotaxis protein